MKEDGMNREDQNSPDRLEELLDKSLAQYSQAEPLAGIEERIFARLQGAAAEPTPGWASLVWQRWGMAATAGLLVAGIALGGWLVTGPGEDIDYVGENTSIDVNSGPVETATAALPPRIPAEAFRASPQKLAGMFAVNPVVRLQLAPAAESPSEAASSGVANSVPREEVFPAPVPLSEQERLALAYMRMSQRLPVTMAAAVPEPGIRELEVPILQVAPLKVEELEKPAADANTNANTSK